MAKQEPEKMEKEVVVKDDGRRLIYYRFSPTTKPAPAQNAARGEHQA
ncbi:MAG TPA: hypothetical protein V6D47_02790 [Oscillatoriaceae cyanobacterium]